jgi:hypothetical protein
MKCLENRRGGVTDDVIISNVWHYLIFGVLMMANLVSVSAQSDIKNEVILTLRSMVLTDADKAMEELPVTVTAYLSERSPGGKHDFYSEGDYWWPDSLNLHGPYIQRDGRTNPQNFVAHRHAMIRLSKIIGALSSAYYITKDEKYVRTAIPHLKAWFADTATMMNPSLLYAQAIKGRVTGRGIGIIDTIHLMEVAQGISVMETSKAFDASLLLKIKTWFSVYLDWLTTHPYGKDEMNAENNHKIITPLAGLCKLLLSRSL